VEMAHPMTASTEPAVYRLCGYMGIRSDKLRTDVQLDLQERLSLKGKAWRDFPPTEVSAYFTKDGHFWLPRFYFDGAIKRGMVGKYPIKFEWTDGAPINLTNLVTLDPKRGQPEAVDAMEKYIREHSGGILVAPTGTGKTILGYSIGQRLQRAMGILVYNSHMLDNWVKTAYQVFGLKPDEVGVVQSDQCDLGKPVTIMMIQSLLAREYPKELYEQIGLLITDESPRFAAPSWNEVMRLFPARYRLSLSADPKRDDGLDKLIEWHLGKVGHRITAITAKPAVVQMLYKVNYDKRKFCDWNTPEPNPVKYDKLLQADKGRNATIIEELVKMRLAGRRILVFSRFKNHLSMLSQAFEQAWDPGILQRLADGSDAPEEPRQPTKITMLIGGLKDAKLQAAMEGDVIFTTYAFARDALNLPTIDTLVFATPTGKPLQPIGRLRDKGDPNRRPLMALDIYELPDYSRNKARRRVETYDDLKLKTSQVERNAKVLK